MSEETTRDIILNTSVQLMLENGYHATSISDIVKIVGIRKSSFFHHFASKEELGVEVLQHFLKPMADLLSDEQNDADRDALERVFTYVDQVANGITQPDVPTACLFGNFAQELSYNNPRLRVECMQVFDWWANQIKNWLNQAQAQYQATPPPDTRGLAQLFIVIYEGALILAKSTENTHIIYQQFEHYKRYLKQSFKGMASS